MINGAADADGATTRSSKNQSVATSRAGVVFRALRASGDIAGEALGSIRIDLEVTRASLADTIIITSSTVSHGTPLNTFVVVEDEASCAGRALISSISLTLDTVRDSTTVFDAFRSRVSGVAFTSTDVGSIVIGSNDVSDSTVASVIGFVEKEVGHALAADISLDAALSAIVDVTAQANAIN